LAVLRDSKRLLLAWPLPIGVVLVVVVAFASTVHPYGAVKRPGQKGDQPFVTDPAAAAVFSRSCVNCHSNNTTWPWYSYVPPVSWLIEKDVEQGRKHFNLSNWSAYSRDEKSEILAEIARVVANQEMPLRQYLLLHKDARLSDRDTQAVLSWARAQRRMLRESSGSERGTSQ
jgi:hypothetical protein